MATVLTEADWNASADPDALLEHLRGRISERKLRLFVVACCRRVGHLLTEPRCKQAVEVAERFADDLVGTAELEEVHAAAQLSKPLFADANWAAAWAAAPQATRAAAEAPFLAAQAVARIAADSARSAAWAAVRVGAPDSARAAAWASFEAITESAQTAERREQAGLLREMTGNPLGPSPVCGPWSASVVALANALYAGEPCAFALHDALLEDNHPELAEHFSGDRHPKGCWGLDWILGKR